MLHEIRHFFNQIGLPRLGRTITAFCSEPIHSLRASIYYLLGCRKSFQFYGMNPSQISEDQAQQRAILLIHGNFHNQSAWLALAKALQNYDLGPIYTVNLPPGPLTEKDREILNAKLQEIQSHYAAKGQVGTIDIVGHSRGSEVAFLAALEDRCYELYHGEKRLSSNLSFKPQIGKVLRVGTPTDAIEMRALSQDLLDRIFEINAQNDCFIPQKSLLQNGKETTFPTGHLGLLFSSQVHRQIASILTV